MILQDICAWLESQPLSVAIAESDLAFPVIETLHVLALSLVIGSIAWLDLRLLGLSSRDVPVKRLAKGLLPITWACFAVAATSGLLMFVSKASTYYENVPFRLKVAALALAGVNMAVFHIGTYRTIDRWGASATLPTGAKAAGALSLLIWSAVVVFGRWIGFV